jgi:predicted dehydrogenase
VRIPTLTGLHRRWTIASVDAGTHVLCEKPSTASARPMAEQIATTDRTVIEAFHYRRSPD